MWTKLCQHRQADLLPDGGSGGAGQVVRTDVTAVALRRIAGRICDEVIGSLTADVHWSGDLSHMLSAFCQGPSQARIGCTGLLSRIRAAHRATDMVAISSSTWTEPRCCMAPASDEPNRQPQQWQRRSQAGQSPFGQMHAHESMFAD